MDISPAKVSLKALRKEAKRCTLKVGDKVVFLPMGGIWGDLRGLTGTIIKKNKDPMWMFEVEIDTPHLMYAPEDHMNKKDEFVSVVSPSALILLKEISPEDLPHVNGGLGLGTISKKMSTLVAKRRIWNKILEMDEKALKHSKSHIEKTGDAEARSFYNECIESETKQVEWSKKRIAKFTASIEALKKKGEIEPAPVALR